MGLFKIVRDLLVPESKTGDFQREHGVSDSEIANAPTTYGFGEKPEYKSPFERNSGS